MERNGNFSATYSSPEIRARAINSLGLFGAHANSAISALEQSCADADAWVRTESTNALLLTKAGAPDQKP